MLTSLLRNAFRCVISSLFPFLAFGLSSIILYESCGFCCDRGSAEFFLRVLCVHGCVLDVGHCCFVFPFFRLSSVPVARCSLASVLRYQSRAPTWQVFCRSWAARMAGTFDSCNGVCRCLMWFVVCQ